MDFRHPVEFIGPHLIALAQRFGALRGKAAVINPVMNSLARQGLVLHLGPTDAPGGNHLLAVPFTGLRRPKPMPVCLAQTEHHMRMMIAGIISLLRLRFMDSNIGHHAMLHTMLGHKPPHQLKPLLIIQLVRQSDVELTCELGILAPLDRLHLVPERRPILHPVRGIIRYHDLLMGHPASAAVVVRHPCPFILKPLSGTVGSRRDTAATGSASDHLSGQMVAWHSSSFVTFGHLCCEAMYKCALTGFNHHTISQRIDQNLPTALCSIRLIHNR